MSTHLPPGYRPPEPPVIPHGDTVIPATTDRPVWMRVPIYKLQLLGDPVLREKCVPFDRDRDEAHLGALVHAMTAIVDRASGYGLAANQMGAAVRVIIARIAKAQLVTMINPGITARSSDCALMVEACLSVPRFETKKIRHKRVTVDYLDEHFERTTVHLAGLPAQIVQHEVDHLNGWMLTDGISKKNLRQAEELVAEARKALDR